MGRVLLGARQAVLRLDVRWELLALAHLFTELWEAHPSVFYLPSTVGKGNGSSPSANGIPEMDVLFRREAQPVNLLDANAAEEQKPGHKLGAICVLAARGWCWEAPATFPGTTICFPQAEGESGEFNGSAICLQSF